MTGSADWPKGVTAAMKNKWSKILFWFFALLPFLISAAFYSRLPAQVAVHFDASGAPNGYASRAVAAFGLPAFYVGMILLVFVMMKIDPRSENINRSPQMRAVALWSPVILFNLLQVVILLMAVHVRLNISVILNIAVGVLFMGIGNYLPKCKPNYTVGIKLPWTLANEENWRKTHRFAGPLWIVGGVIIALSAFWAPAWVWVVIAVTVLVSLVPAVYSYLIFRRGRSNKQ